ncbi:MAG: uroporphyrinogen decarboxylase family protein [Planctomycetota bacterium]|nr:uroporphyrinogen decarboxylase family protein [Planctomycetota bacterium]
MMSRRDRLMATLRGEPVDRPAVNFYEVGGFDVDPSDPDEFNVYNDPSWQPLLELAEGQSDLIRMRSPAKSRCHEVDAGSPRGEFFVTEEYVEGGCRCRRVTLTIAGRTMTSLTRRRPDADTIWTIEHLLKSTDDLKAYLELPDEVFAEDIDVTGLIEEDRKLGDRGIVMVDTEDPLCAAASLFNMADYTVIALTEQKLFHQLLEKLSGHIHARTEKTAIEFPGHLWRIYGPEYAAEPYLPPYLFAEYVVRYTGPMVETIQRHGGFARVHCHGRIRAVLDYIVEMGPTAIDPIEPPPQGDMDLAQVRREYGERLVLFGNIEYADIENTEPAQFKRIIQKSLSDGTQSRGKGFVLMPSSAPIGRKVTPQVLANYETMVRLATST